MLLSIHMLVPREKPKALCVPWCDKACNDNDDNDDKDDDNDDDDESKTYMVNCIVAFNCIYKNNSAESTVSEDL